MSAPGSAAAHMRIAVTDHHTPIDPDSWCWAQQVIDALLATKTLTGPRADRPAGPPPQIDRRPYLHIPDWSAT